MVVVGTRLLGNVWVGSQNSFKEEVFKSSSKGTSRHLTFGATQPPDIYYVAVDISKETAVLFILKLDFVLFIYLFMMLITYFNYICLWQIESESEIKRNDASSYLNYVVKRLQEEEDRSDHCFDKSTTPLLVTVVEDGLITAHMETLVEVQYCHSLTKCMRDNSTIY